MTSAKTKSAKKWQKFAEFRKKFLQKFQKIFKNSQISQKFHKKLFSFTIGWGGGIVLFAYLKFLDFLVKVNLKI